MKPALLNMFVAALLVFAACQNKTEKTELKEAVPDAESDLPNMLLTFPDGSNKNAKNLGGNVVLVLFQPDCDHCQREAVQIKENLEGFRQMQVYFISSAPMPEIKKFATEYLADHPKIVMAATETKSILDNFGPIEAPSLYIYNESGKLVESFNGEVAIEVVLKYIH